MDRYQLYIGGQWTDGHSGKYIQVENPATEEIIAEVPEGDEEDVNRAVEAAREAFKTWKNSTPMERCHYLNKIADYLEEHKDEIGKTVTAELGAPVGMVQGWHVEAPVAEARFFAQTALDFKYEEKVKSVIIRREPVGVVAGLTPWNYPLDQVTVKILPALAAGNCVVLKPSQQAPLSAYWFTKAVIASGMPAGVFNLVTGRGGNIGNAMAAHPGISMISLTGSTGAGREVGCLAMSNIKKLTLELGGKSAAVLLESGDMRLAVDAVLTKCFMNTGQTCSALTRFVAPYSMKEELEAYMKEKAATFTVGDPLDPDTVLGPLVNESSYKKVCSYIKLGVEEGATMLYGSVPAEKTEKGYYVDPVIFTDVTMDMRIAKEEIFGPVLCVIYYKTKEEALAIANDSEYGLSGAVIGEEAEALDFAREMETGVIHVNGGPFIVEAPFGGYKQSGLGRENSKFSFDEYLEIKAMLLTH